MPSRRRFLRGLASASLVAALTGGAGCASNPAAPTTTRVVAFGDSLVSGTGTTNNNDFASVLARRLNVSIVNAGRPGDTTTTALARLGSAVLARGPEVVIVLLGGNDLLQGVPIELRVANMAAIIEGIRAIGAKVIVVGLGPAFLDPFQGALPELASRTASTLVPDILAGIFGNPDLMADSIHPNNSGHAIMADRIEPALRAALGL